MKHILAAQVRICFIFCVNLKQNGMLKSVYLQIESVGEER